MSTPGLALAKCYKQGLIPANAFLQMSIRCSHAHVFRKRPAQLIVNRIKDIVHFYMIGIGLMPVLGFLFYLHVVNGTCELKDIPTEGPPPAYWQFERTPARQWFARNFGISDMEHHERNLAYYEKMATVSRWRKIEQRMRHLESERLDYKGWHYTPVSADWIDLATRSLRILKSGQLLEPH
ncbi:unnamed protein product, partial [Mesorhabditis belari]|uniref:NADH dehydrogenase [ubiquinone] 1 beta subcomplex subunit 5, mitochondrial n=1 Tax=Mesorhabditis belari TaxID=2138241 RepID=A0AAF3JA76_9BILA